MGIGKMGIGKMGVGEMGSWQNGNRQNGKHPVLVAISIVSKDALGIHTNSQGSDQPVHFP